ncbi:MAG: zinc-binding dehydrogenase [Paracoccus sp. (in: a-proteobacteria)]|uniref:zinc-binding dehydrogenase n=1 Tax=Paracoccus sp. TaxID=267 RepID=UPI0026E110C0|nr:zinc-binding dehydrogenase [Paracoccus sp. (in: a-proteobacteria)]MDO5621995.1 zinc-binding dehydrogenase [Paracoccus sp. (in: a-proteobacteria)]
MKAAIHDAFGDPAKVLATAEAPLPEPRPGQVRLRVILTPIHNHDLWTVRGSYGYKPELPAIGGSECVGVIDALGGGVEGLVPGQRVAAAGLFGSWAGYVLASAKGVVPLPDTIPDEAAAQLIAMPFSAATLLDFLNVSPGDWVVQNAANGAVGKVLAGLAAAKGINVINLVRREKTVAEMAALGLPNTIATTEGWKDRARALTGGAPIRAAVDSIGGKASGDLLSLLADDGLLVSFGSMEGEPMQIPSGDLIFKQAVIKGFWGSKVSAAMDGETRKRLMTELVTQVVAGKVRLPVQAIFPLDQIADAVTASLTPGKAGKVLLKP